MTQPNSDLYRASLLKLLQLLEEVHDLHVWDIDRKNDHPAEGCSYCKATDAARTLLFPDRLQCEDKNPAPSHIAECDAVRCICGNTVNAQGFYPCDLFGAYVEPTPDEWPGTLRVVCDRCGRIFDQETGNVLGYRNISAMPTEAVRATIEILQGIQSISKPTSTAWKDASKHLAPLFAEMAKREPSK